MALRLRGRQAQIETLREQLDTTRAGRGGIVVIKGLAGLGKSALLTAAGELARAKGISVYAGAGDVATQVVPLGPLLEALVAADDPPVDPAVLRDLSHSPDQRFWLLRELQESLERAALRSPMLISIDDVQWADAATLVALEYAAPAPGAAPDPVAARRPVGGLEPGRPRGHDQAARRRGNDHPRSPGRGGRGQLGHGHARRYA